jgi:ABC-type nickel/cobalt efflux system permease component RcnA
MYQYYTVSLFFISDRYISFLVLLCWGLYMQLLYMIDILAHTESQTSRGTKTQTHTHTHTHTYTHTHLHTLTHTHTHTHAHAHAQTERACRSETERHTAQWWLHPISRT